MSKIFCRQFAAMPLTLLLALPFSAKAQAPVAPQGSAIEATQIADPMTRQTRAALSRQFMTRWSSYVEQVYGTQADVWQKRMATTFAVADPANFRNAMQRDTFEGALAELTGTGHRINDDQIIDQFARSTLASQGSDKGTPTPQTIGSITNDLVFTAVAPCRLVDTRLMGGPIAANTSRDFFAVTFSAGDGFTFQGGSATGCDVVSASPSAVAINVTAVSPAAAGYATVFKYGSTRPLAASVNYTAGAIVNNSVIVGIPNPFGSSDFSIYTFASANYVVDIVGYFSPPEATALQCVSTAQAANIVAAGANTYTSAPLCPAGYQATTPYCWGNGNNGVYSTGSGFIANSPANGLFCGWNNTTAAPQTVFTGAVCCRVPGK